MGRDSSQCNMSADHRMSMARMIEFYISTGRVPLAALRGFVFSFSYSYSAKGLGGFGVACSGDQYDEGREDVLTREMRTGK